MSLPVRCGRCGAIYSSGIILPPSAAARLLGDGEPVPLGEPVHCAVCRREIDRTDVAKTLEALTLIIADQPTASQVRELRELIDSLLRARAPEDQVRSEVEAEAKAFPRLRAGLPKSRAELYGMLALVVALTTLAEQILADLPALDTLLDKLLGRGGAGRPEKPAPTTDPNVPPGYTSINSFVPQNNPWGW
ncbi:hypothetical protein FB565_008973 [Actinoplanes lutulentus]|uniref:Uncharacterized protein n=1 Tax=Actinoplanes lutulentus TaxID=1287878 RepID=A0A327ZB29_9ACTN|nr:hypothetical protein [Actinoplanes lutulentus]MBB2949168.1 hypothetical protein [Actinoplanes lutulentus]RAK34652.1 hypothetical protein B0I29_111254 [Actinoplanes lutulentus]